MEWVMWNGCERSKEKLTEKDTLFTATDTHRRLVHHLNANVRDLELSDRP